MKQILQIIIFLICSFHLNAQNADSIHLSNKASINGSYLKSYMTDTRDVFLFPKHFSKKNWIVTGVFVSSTGIMMTQDEKIQRFIQENSNHSLDVIAEKGFEPFGNIYSLATMGAFYLHGQLWQNERSKKVALLGIKSYAISGLIVTIPKYLLGRHRPYSDTPPNSQYWEGPSLSHRSFPSGHTTSIFSVATIIALEYKDHIMVPISAYTLATLVGFSRMYENKHWASDVIMGAGLGTLVGYIIHKQNNWNIDIKPASDKNMNGFSLIIPIQKQSH